MKDNNTTYRIFEHINEVDISEQDILDYDPEVLDKLLIDHTMSAKARYEANDQKKVVNIFWATSDYEDAIKNADGLAKLPPKWLAVLISTPTRHFQR